MRKIFKIRKTQTEKPKMATSYMHTMDEQRQTWTEYFKGRLIRSVSETMADIQPASHHFDIE